MTTWRFESMCTRTLSMTISTRPVMLGLSHRPGVRSAPHRTGPNEAQEQSDDHAQDEAADVGEEGHAPGRRVPAERADAADQLEDEPEAEEDQGRDLEQLVEEPQEHERQDARAREQHE